MKLTNQINDEVFKTDLRDLGLVLAAVVLGALLAIAIVAVR